MEKIPGMNFLIEGVVKYVDVQGLAEVARQSGRNALDGALVAAQLVRRQPALLSKATYFLSGKPLRSGCH